MKTKQQMGHAIQKRGYAPQMRVQTAVRVGASLESCLENLEYWQKEYYKKCGQPRPMPYGS